MYSINNATVRWKNYESRSFCMGNGIKQGGILSPYLFALYLDPLLSEVNLSKYGCYIGDNPCNIFAFADDVALVSQTVMGLKKLINICENYGAKFSVKFNPDKSQIMSFPKSNLNFKVELNGCEIKNFNEVKHLGFMLNNTRYSYNINNVINDIKIRTNCIITNFRCLDTWSRVSLFNTQCLSLYGCCLWDCSATDVARLEIE